MTRLTPEAARTAKELGYMGSTRMVGAVAVLVGMAALAGCAPEERLKIEAWREVEPLPQSADATAMVVSFYGLHETPDVHWYGGAGLDCPSGVDWKAVTADHPEGECTAGLSLGGVVALSDLGRMRPIHQTKLTHEFGHMLSSELGEGGDPNHTGHVFAPGGEMDQANAMLAAAGM